MGSVAVHKIEENIASLTDRFPIKVWSYIMTIFGDLSGGEDPEVSGPVLSMLTERIGIKPQAMRVALHRLRKDGWIEARKVGRVSYYRLSEGRFAEARDAGERIFSTQGYRSSSWFVTLADPSTPSDKFPTESALLVSKGVQVSQSRPDSLGKLHLVMEVTSAEIPDWIRSKFVRRDWEIDCRDFLGFVHRIRRDLTGGQPDRLLDRMTLRLLVVHNWRRLVLRHSPSVEMLQAEDWIGHSCRRATLDILAELPRGRAVCLGSEVTSLP